jgi:3-sulfinopropanoyl-CoA desulfinase
MPFDLPPEQQALKEKARALARGEFAHRAAEIDRSEQYPWENVALLWDAGFLGMTISRTYGGPRDQ